jgi:diguanylate cyclase (GGDEF)-like protein
MRHRLFLRVVALGGMVPVCLLFPAIGPYRYFMAAVLLALTPVPVLLPRVVPVRRWMLAQSVFDVTATVALVGFVPNVWTVALVIVVCSPAASSALLGRRAYVALEVFGLAGIGLVGHLTGAEGWAVPLAVAALMVPLVASYVDVYLAQELRAAARLDDVAESSSAVFWEVEADSGAFLRISGRVEEVLGYPVDQLPRVLPDLLDEDDRRDWWRLVDASDAGGDDHFSLECRLGGPDGSGGPGGEERWLRLNVRRVMVNRRALLRGIAFDITELARSHRELKARAETDHLTGLPNRFLLVTTLAARLEAGEGLALVIIDLDRFKDINDTLGHEAGDAYLQTMAGRLRAAADDGRTMVARMGGDEFAVLVEPQAGLDELVATARGLVAACETPVTIAGVDFAGSASCGIALAPDHGRTAEDLLRRADLAMYAAKKSGGSVHVFEFANDESKIKRLQLSAEVGTALDSGQVRLWFQPKVELVTGRIIGAEALLRWHHPLHGVLMPGEFLDMVELTKYRRQLCHTILDQGIAFLAQDRAGEAPFSVAVNISIRDLLDPDFTTALSSRLTAAGVSPERLTLEITEREIMDDRTGFARAAEVIRATGVHLSIDDFGTGHSSLLRLHQLPVTELKIDRSFVSGLTTDAQAKIITKAIIELGRSLGHDVVAEGIESPDEVEVLQALGCGVGQGFLYAAALPPDELRQLLAGPSTLGPDAPAIGPWT